MVLLSSVTKTNPQHTENQEDNESLPPETGARAIEIFKAIIQANFYEAPGLPEDITKLFPVDHIISCCVNQNDFTVEFDTPAKAMLETGEGVKASYLHSAIFKIPKVIKGIFNAKGCSIDFPDAKKALWIEKTVMYVPIYLTLSGVEYHQTLDQFTLKGITSVTVSREQFKQIFQNYKFIN